MGRIVAKLRQHRVYGGDGRDYAHVPTLGLCVGQKRCRYAIEDHRVPRRQPGDRGVDLCQLHDSVEDVHIILRPDSAVLIKGPKAHALGPQIFRQSIQDRFRQICADPFAQRQNFDGLDRQLLWED